MAAMGPDVSFDFTFPCDPSTPPSFHFDPSLLEMPFNAGHARSSSNGSVYSMASMESSPESVSTRRTTPPASRRSSPPIRQHGPLLLPKIRQQDQTVESSPPKKRRTTPTPAPRHSYPSRATHARSFTSPDSLNQFMSFNQMEDLNGVQSLTCSPVNYPQDLPQGRRASSCNLDEVDVSKYGFPTYRQMPVYLPSGQHQQHPHPHQHPHQHQHQQPQQSIETPPSAASFLFNQAAFAPRAPSPLSMTPVTASGMPSTPGLTAMPPVTSTMPAALPSAELSDMGGPSTTMLDYLTLPNPTPSLVRTISFPLRDPHTRHFWWDVRQIRPWSSFTTETILNLPGASTLLGCPVPASLLPTPAVSQRHPETEQALHSIYSQFYLPKLNAALAMSSSRPMTMSVPGKMATATTGFANDCMFIAHASGDAASAAHLFGGKPTARVVGLVKAFDKFNTGMRVEGNIKRVEYLRGLAHLHHAMREHSCRYGFIMTEIEMVIVRNGAEGTPHFGYLEVTSVQLNAAGDGDESVEEPESVPLTACLALWGLCAMAGDETWRSDIGAPAEGTRRKALPRDDWMPQPQLAEKREAKRARGWVFPEDPIGRKELGKRGVRYGAC